MNQHRFFANSPCEEEVYRAQHELSSFLAAVTRLYGPEQAWLSAEDWLEESEFVESPPRLGVWNWRAVTIAAAARLATRVKLSAVATAA